MFNAISNIYYYLTGKREECIVCGVFYLPYKSYTINRDEDVNFVNVCGQACLSRCLNSNMSHRVDDDDIQHIEDVEYHKSEGKLWEDAWLNKYYESRRNYDG